MMDLSDARRRAIIERLEPRQLLNAVLTEALAQNTAGASDEDGTFSDWIEVHNPTTAPIDLTGYFLTDDLEQPAQWRFPAGVTLAPKGFLLVWASGKDRRSADAPLHTNFALKASGEHVALLMPDGATVASGYRLPPQSANVSYGIVGEDFTAPTFAFFSTPTPGVPNNAEAVIAVAEPQFSRQRGFYDDRFDLALTTDTPGASIRYTTDGSAPSATSGRLFTGPISISTTRAVRAVAFRESSVSTVVTHSYIFLDDVLKQPASIAGFPNVPRLVTGDNEVMADSEMDPAIVNSSTYSGMIKDAMQAIPTISLTTAQSDLFGSNGFYDAHDTEGLERPVSLELIDPANPSSNSGVTAGAEGHGDTFLKRAIRISFKEQYGPTKWETPLLQNGPLNGDSASRTLDGLVLRGGKNRSWAHGPRPSSYVEDQWYRDSQTAMNGFGSHGTFVHLYLNGVYWGLYNVAERPDENWQAEYFGGQEDDYFSVNHGDRRRGDGSRWDYLRTQLIAKDLTDPSNYQELRQYLDVEQYSDYLILSFFQGLSDWPRNNWFGGHRTGDEVTPFRYFAWDGEFSWNKVKDYNFPVNGAFIHPAFLKDSDYDSDNSRIWKALSRNKDFMTVFADRVHKHISNDGALTDENSIARFDALTSFIKDAIVGESARWGDAHESRGYGTLTQRDWQNEVDDIRSIMQGNGDRLVAALRAEDFYPSIDPARFSRHGGRIEPGFQVELTNPNSGGTIYYTTDGADPRLPGGEVAPSAVAYSGPITLPWSTTLRTRIREGSQWSAQDAAEFTVQSDVTLRVTEIMYHPPAPLSPDTTDKEEFEFIRLQNVGDTPLDLAGVALTGGIEFTFAGGTLLPGQSVVVVEDSTAFLSRYGGADTIAGEYQGKLANAGENLRLTDAVGNIILDFNYDDAWHPQTDGQGYALVVVDPLAAPSQWSDQANWQPSDTPHGGPRNPSLENKPPMVTAFGPASITLPAGASVEAVVTDDGRPSGATTILWSKVDGPGEVAFADPTASSTGVTFSQPGVYVLRATANDGELSGAADLTINVLPAVEQPGPASPIARFVLVDARTGQDLAAINHGDVINLAAFSARKINVRAVLDDQTVASVRFGFDRKPGKFKPSFRLANGGLYSLFGDKRGRYKRSTLRVGAHRLSATPYTGLRGKGVEGTPMVVEFTVIKSPVDLPGPSAAPGLG